MIRVGERLETLAQSGSIFTNGLGLLYIKRTYHRRDIKKELIIFTQFQNSVNSISDEINTVKIYGSIIEKTEQELFDYYFIPLKVEDYIEILEDDNDILSSDQDIPF